MSFTTVAVTFNTSSKLENVTRTQTYTYKTKFKSFSPGDLAIVKSVGGSYKVVRIVEAHDTPQIDPNARYEYKWIFGTIVEFSE